MARLNQVPRPEKLGIATNTRTNLIARKAKGPPEAILDGYIDELAVVAANLTTHVTGKTTADAARSALNVAVDVADAKADTYFRHIEGYLETEALDRHSPNAPAARALHDAAFPDGLEPINEYVIDQNIYCRAALTVLRSPESQETLTAIALPAAWLDGFETAIKASSDAMDQLLMARGDVSAHVGMGRDAEEAWVDVMVRLRRYIASRAKRGDRATQIENKRLLEPLLVALKKLDAEAAARATRRKDKQAPAAAKGAEGADGAAEAQEASVDASVEMAPPASVDAPSVQTA